MAGLWVWDNGSWREMKTPYVRDAGQWKQGEAAWVWDSSQFDWIKILSGAAVIQLTNSVMQGVFSLEEVFQNSQFSGTQPDRIVFVLPATTSPVPLRLSNTFPFSTIPFWTWNPEITLQIESGAKVYGFSGGGGAGAGAKDRNGNPIDDAIPVDSPGVSGKSGAFSGGPGVTAKYPVLIDNQGTIAGGGGGGGGGASIGITRPDTIFIGQTGEVLVGGGGGGGGRGAESSGFAPTREGGISGGTVFSDDSSGVNLTFGELLQSPEPGVDSNANFSGGGGAKGRIRDTTDTSQSLILNSGAGGAGGDLAQPGVSGSGTFADGSLTSDQNGPLIGNAGAGAPPGLAIDGISNVTFINRGTIIGSEVN